MVLPWAQATGGVTNSHQNRREQAPWACRDQPGSEPPYDVVQLAHHFGASRLSMLFRLRNLRFVAEAECKYLRTLDEEDQGKQLAEPLGLPEPDHAEMRSEFKHRSSDWPRGIPERRGLLRQAPGTRRDGRARGGRSAQLVEDAGLDPDATRASL